MQQAIIFFLEKVKPALNWSRNTNPDWVQFREQLIMQGVPDCNILCSLCELSNTP